LAQLVAKATIFPALRLVQICASAGDLRRPISGRDFPGYVCFRGGGGGGGDDVVRLSFRRAVFSISFAMEMSRIDQIAAPASRSLGPYPETSDHSMTITRLALYPHRHNYDGSFDSICRTCFATIGRARNEATLAELEKIHSCDPGLLAGREVLLSRPQRIGIHLVPCPVERTPDAEPAIASGTSRWMQKPDM
jgi:hypothetical protein